MKLARYKAAITAFLVLLLVVAAGCQKATDNQPGTTTPGTTPPGTSTSGDSATLKIGVPLSLTGFIAEQAEEMVNAYKLYLEQNGNKLGGVPVELIVEDVQADPNMVVTKTRKLIEHDQVHFIGGGALAFEGLAIYDVALANNMAVVIPVASADDISQRMFNPIIARLNMTSSQPNLAFGDYAYNKLGYKKVAIVAQDYAYGWESAAGFQTSFEAAGGKVVTKIWASQDTADYGPYVRQIPEDVDAVYAILVGANVPRFVKAYQDFGLKDKIPLIGGPDMADQDALRFMGDEALDIVNAHEYNPGLERTKPFVDAFSQKYGKKPSYWGEATYTVAMWVDRALTEHQKKTGMKPEEIPNWIRNNPKEFIDAIRAVELPDAPRGPLKLDDYNNAIMDVYIARVVKQDGELAAEVIDTIPQVSQFWTFSAEEFLKNPVYSRDFPPLQP